MNKSVYDLRDAVMKDIMDFPLSVKADYGFNNCKTNDDFKSLFGAIY